MKKHFANNLSKLLIYTLAVISILFLTQCSAIINKNYLKKSLELGTDFILNNQKPQGNFNYMYDWLEQEFIQGDNQVRQAGAAWGSSLIHQYTLEKDVLESLEKALQFFDNISKVVDNKRFIVYPKVSSGSLGTVALVALAYIDLLRVADKSLTEEKTALYRSRLDEYLNFLVAARQENGMWHNYYNLQTGKSYGRSSPYSDGESLLALIKTAKYLDRPEFLDVIYESAQVCYKNNVFEALLKDPDSNTTKGYYQWGSMAYYEMSTTDWPNVKKYGDYVVQLADWMIDIHETLRRTRNTAYAYEGIICAYKIAKDRKDRAHVKKFKYVIKTGLTKLTSWQVGHPLANDFIRTQFTGDDDYALGGVQNHRKEAPLRIDVAQHQMHAVILALKYVFK